MNSRFADTGNANEETRFNRANVPVIPPESRENPEVIDNLIGADTLDLIEHDEIRGVVHAHSTYSDGTGTLEQMARGPRRSARSWPTVSPKRDSPPTSPANRATDRSVC